MPDRDFVQQFDVVPQFWQFLRGLRSDDLIVELIQNELDANASHTSIAFTPDRLVCEGDGEPVSEDGWQRLAYVTGAGDRVESKRSRIGVKNHGLKACFTLGDEIVVRSNGLRMIQTLYKDGYENQPSPGTFPEPVPDYEEPLTGCTVEVPYRQQDLVVPKGEALTLDAPDENSLQTLFRNACELLPSRLLGVVSPGIRDQYTLSLSHYILGSVELRWRAKRRRRVTGRSRRRFVVFGRECITASDVSGLPSTSVQEQACAFRVPYPTGQRIEMPDFFVRDKNSFTAEIAWHTDKRGTPKSTRGVRRYPIGYHATSVSALSGVGVHFSGPYVSDAERHGASQMDRLNDYIDDACKVALVEIMASHLLHRHGGKAMELYMADPGSPDDESLSELVERTLARRALPLRDKTLQASKRSKRLALGPRRTSGGGSRRVVLPMFTWDRERISPLLSEICPNDEDEIDRTVPGPILSYLGEHCYEPNDGFNGLITTFDENDAIERLQPQLEAEHFPWKDETEWRAVLSNPSVAKSYLDVAYETTQRDGLDSDSDVPENTYVPDERSTAQPLADMFSAVNLPPTLGEQQYVPILHSELQDHPLLKKRAWKLRPFLLEDYLSKAELERALVAERKSFWTWLRSNWRIVKKQTLIQIADLPIWPSSNRSLVPLDDLCEPRSTRVASIMGNAISRPSRALLRSGLVSRTGRGRLTFRHVPTIQECEEFLWERMKRFPGNRQLTPDERREFRQIEKDLGTLVSYTPRLREYVGELSEGYGLALDKDGNLREPDELVKAEGVPQRLYLLNKDIIDRPNSNLDRIDGWRPRASPSTDQIVNTLQRDSARHDAHVPRLQEYVRQARREGVPPDGLLDLPCIPVEGKLRSPNQIALGGRRDFWGDWKISVPVAGINAEVQRLYKHVGVVGGEPDSSSSREFFQWLASQDADTVARHAEPIIRHIGHKSGPRAWSDEYPRVPFILVESDDGRDRLVTKADATKARSRVVVPDFGPLEDAIRRLAGRRPVDLAIVASPRVTQPITTHLRNFGLRTLSDVAGEPERVVGEGSESSSPDGYLDRILHSLRSGVKGRQLRKRLSNLGLDSADSRLRSNWRERLSRIRGVETADSVNATYKLGRNKFTILEDGKLDKESGTLWLRSGSDLQASFFDVIADHIFDRPPKYYGSVLDRAYRMDMKERDPLENVSDAPSYQGGENGNAVPHHSEDGTLSATSGIHAVPKPDPLSNVPKPGPIPSTDSGIARGPSKPTGGTTRPQSAIENVQIDDLKENQYAWHCQACLAAAEPKILAPSSSYVELSENRKQVMHAHHCDHVNAGGARHAGNILLLCRYHHLALGDAVTRIDVLRAFEQAGRHSRTFNADDGVSKCLQGEVVTIHPPQRRDPVSLFFTKEHAAYWLTKADGEGLE